MGPKLLRYLIILLTISSFASQTGFAQCSNPNGSDYPAPPGPTSCEAVSFCNGEINGYCGQLSTTNVTWPGSLCNGNGVPNNMEWLAFVAAYTTITITVNPFNCPGVPGGFQGIQAGIYDDCESGPGAVVPGACQTACSTGPINLTSNNFIVGNVYYLFIDGCSGDMCEYSIDVTPFDATALPDLINPSVITGPLSICAGASGITYSIPEIFSAIDYVWTVPAGWTVNQTSPGNEVTIDFPNTTTSGQICVVAENDCHDTDLLCITVNVAPIPPTNDVGYYCEGEEFIYPSDGVGYPAGFYSVTLDGASFQGCDSTVLLTVVENPDVEYEIEIAICQDEDYFVCGIPYEIEGTFNIECGPSFQGCDSTIILNMVILNPSVDIAGGGVLGCDLSNPLFLDGFGSEGDSFLWTTSDGDICDDPTSPFIQVCAVGTYCLTSTMEYTTATQGTVSCTAQDCVVVTPSSETPMTTVVSTDIACNGETNGTATITVDNSTIGPFTYNWMPNVSLTNTATGLSDGVYMVTVTANANGCTSIETITIEEPTDLTLSTAQTNGSCDGDTNGTATVTASGGTTGYSYAWCNGQTTAMATGLAVGQCCVTVTDASNCTEEICVDITTPTAMTASTTQVNVDCNGANTGSGTVTVGGGTPGYTYLWCNGETTATASNLIAGQCCVVVTDANNCTIESCVDLTESPGMTLSTSQNNVSCEGGSDGSATVTPSGGAGGYSYLWCNSQTTQTATNLSATPCAVVVTDANGCTSTATVTPTQPTAIVLSTGQTDVNCIGQSDGTAIVNASGGAGGFTYLWCDGQTTQEATGLPAAPCIVVVTDMNGCINQTSVTLTEPATAISISGTSVDAACGNNNGSISITVSGGTAGYTYQWTPSGGAVEDPTGLGPGTYTVVVTDANTCTETFSIDVNVPSGLTLSNTATDVSCNGGADGSIDLAVNGGSPPVTYLWDNGAGTVEDPTGLEAGTYNVTVTDGAGCEFVSSAVVGEPDAITASASSSQATCGDDNGSISIIVNGGTGPFNYVWTPGGSTDQNPTGLTPANYSVLITDANACTGTTSVEVTAPDPILLTITPADANCNGLADGSIDLEVSGGTAGYSYAWTGTTSISQDPIGLAAGNYEVTVTDVDNCTMVINTVIGEPTPIVVAFTTTETICGEDNGTANVTVNGGSAPYSYAWNNGGGNTPNTTDLEAISYEVTVTDNNGCSVIETIDISEIEAMDLSISANDANCNGGMDGNIDLEVINGTGPFTYIWTNTVSTDQDPVGLSTNNYSVVVTDLNGCTETIDIDIDEPTEIEITGTAQDAVCGDNNGAISINVNGGAGGYTYVWSPTGDLVEDPAGLGPGTYSVVVTDANNCTATFSIDVETPSGLALSAVPEPTACNGSSTGLIDLDVTGGTGPFQYIWDNGEITEDINDLAAGIYCVTVTDNTNCTIVLCETIDEPAAIEITGNAFDALCGEANGSIAISVNGGTGDYDYLWTPSGSTDQNPTGLAVDNYSVLVTDDNGCTGTFEITVDTPADLESSAVGVDVSCFGGNDGSVDITVIGGTSPYTYAWSNGSTNEDPNDFEEGAVTGTVTDANGCTTEIALVLGQATELSASGTSTEETCGESNGSISITAIGGTAPYTYIWATGLPDAPDQLNLSIGTYCLDVVDANDCIFNICVDVITPNALTLNATPTDANCFGSSDGNIDLEVMGGVTPYTYDWTTTPWNGQDLSDIPMGTYTVIVTDATLCTASLTQVIGEPTLIEVSDISTPAVCGQNNGTSDITATGGVAPYTYLWSNGSVEEDPNNFGSGNYICTVTDANACTATHEVSVVPPNGPMLSVTPSNASCFDGTDGAADLQITGGTTPFTYAWDFGGIVTEDIAGLPAGNYTVIVTDNDGCTYTASTLIQEPEVITINGNATDETCNASNGTITISVAGGTGPYTYLWTPSGSTDQNPIDLLATDHTVVVTDVNGCTGTEIIIVDAPNALTGDVTPSNISCDGGSDGTIAANISGGVFPYSYQWSPMGGTDQTASGLPVGSYTLVVTDGAGCEYTLTEILTAPAALDVNGTSLDATCGEVNGSIDLTVEGGIAPYEFEWLSGLPSTEDQLAVGAGSYTCIVTDANDCSTTYEINVNTPNMLLANALTTDVSCNSGSDGTASVTPSGGVGPFTYLWMPGGSTDQNPIGLSAGTYTVAVTDATNCTVTATALISEPTAISISDITTPAICGDNNGTADITVTGGTSPYTFLWSTGSMDEDPDDFGAGSYNVIVSDANGCTEIHAISIDAPGAPDVSLSPADASCNGDADGGINVTVTDGIPPFTYSWSTGDVTEDLTSVIAGDYVLTITDFDGCTTIYNETVGQPAELTASSLGPNNVSCNGGSNGSISLDVLGGTMPYSFDWDNGAADVQDPNNLVAGTYNVTVTDANGCTALSSAILTEPEALDLTAIPTDANCNNGVDGSIDLNVTGGTGAYTFAWSNTSTNEDPINLGAGNYVVVVTDDNACTESTSAVVAEPDPVLVTVTDESDFGGFNLSCANSEDGFAEVQATGGFSPFTYAWDNGTTGPMSSDLGGGAYAVIATDNNGCTGTTSVSLVGPEDLTVSAMISDVSCYGDNDGAIIVDDISGGTGPFLYALDGGDFTTSSLFGNLLGANYDLTIQDANGCESTQTVQIVEPSELVVFLGDDIEIQLGDSISLEAQLNVDTSFLQQWGWTRGLAFRDNCNFCLERWVYPFDSGVYEFLAIDENGCVDVEELSILVKKDRPVYIPNAFSPNGDGNNDYFQIYLGAGATNVKTFKVFNRWGEIVYELSDFFLMAPDEGWDGMFKGDLMNPAVFVFYAEVAFLDGHVEVYKGDVSLMR